MESWTRGTLALSLMLLGTAAACGRPADTSQASPAASPTERIEIQLARATLMPETGAVYFKVVNPGPQADRLLRVETGAARAAETHESIEENGVMRMVARPDGFEVPAKGELVLEPGGKHVMLIAPQAPADAAGKIALTLHFERAGAVEVQAELAEPGDAGHDHDHGDMDHGDMDHEGMDHGETDPDGGARR